jgi:Ni,Fe-hydrogenase I small subunit
MNHAGQLSLQESSALRRVNRRKFLKFCSATVATLALPPEYVAQVAQDIVQR